MSCEWCGSFAFDPENYCDKCVDDKVTIKDGKIVTTDYIEISSAPYGESCAQVGRADFNKRSVIECRVFKNQLLRIWPDGDFGVKSFNHDFGTYREVVAYFDDENEHVRNIAFEAEATGPEYWDDIAKTELRKAFAEAGLDAPEFAEEYA